MEPNRTWQGFITLLMICVTLIIITWLVTR